MDQESQTRCPHCANLMQPWANPEMSSWSGEFQLVCFNDECPYYVRGWAWMESHYNVNVSYRYRFDPNTSECGPLPVWSKNALKDRILEKKVGDDA
jgi:hypothetical protein